jgi:hypothetical protein
MRSHVLALSKKFKKLDKLLYNDESMADFNNEIITYMTDSDELIPEF